MAGGVPLTLLTLNAASPSPERAEALLAYLWHRPEQVLVLTEMGAGPGSVLIGRVCRAAGYDVAAPPAPPAGAPRGADRLGVLVIGRGATLRPLPGPRPAVLSHRVTAVTVQAPDAPPVRLAGVYGAASDPVRYAASAQRQRKRDWLAAFDAWLPGWLADDGSAGPAVVLGDLNIVAPGHRDELRYVLAQERTTYRRLLDAGLADAYRVAHPDGDPAAAQVSWVDHSGAGCRYDHAFVRGARVLACDLDQRPREEGYTDHAALSLTIDTQAP